MAPTRAPRQLPRLLAAGALTLALGSAPSLVTAQRGPAPVPTGLSPDVLALACAPMPTVAMPEAALHVAGTQESVPRGTFAPGDLIVIDAGESQGIAVGQQFFARRIVRSMRQAPSREYPGVVQTAGWIKIYSVDRTLSLATITYACDTVNKGDYLEPFAPPVVPAAAPRDAGELHHHDYGHVTVGLEQKTTFGKGDFFILDRGSAQGVTPGMRFTVYRNKKEAGVFLYELGEAVAMSVQADTATLVVTLARDAFWTGDLVAMRK